MSYLKSILFIALFFSCLTIKAQDLAGTCSQQGHQQHAPNSFIKQPQPNQDVRLQFIENQNQWEPNIRFMSELGGFNQIFLEDQTLTYLLYDADQTNELHDVIKESDEIRQAHMVSGHAYKVHFLDALKPTFSRHDQRSGYNNYIRGNDSSKWASNVPVYRKVNYENLYDGIDLSAYSLNRNFKYDFIVAPNADASQIQLLYEGADDLFLEDENLIIETSVGTIKELKPYAYQIIDGKERKVACQYVLTNDVLTFDFPQGYQSNLPLVIDPTVVGATLSGTTGGNNFGHTATFDNSGNIYAGGISFDVGYPTTTGAFQENFGGGSTDWAMSKYNPTGTDLIYATYIGGDANDYPHSIIVDFNGQLCIYGITSSSDFPTTSNAVQTTLGGNRDIAITKLSTDGSALIGSTFMGGSEVDGYNDSAITYNYGDRHRGEIVLDQQGNIYVASCSSSNNFPVTANAFQTIYNDNNSTGIAQDGVVMKLNSDLSTLFWSTYLGGNDADMCNTLRVDDFGSVYVTGFAGDQDFPMVPGGVTPVWPGGEQNAYILKLNATGSAIEKGTFWGTSGNEHGYFIDIDEDNQIHIYGTTTGDMPITPGTYFQNTGSRQFLAGFSADLSSLVYSTVIGNGGAQIDFVPVAFMVDKCNGIYFSGYYAKDNLPLTPDYIQDEGSQFEDYFYLGVLEPNATDLQFGTYYGDANHVDGGTSRFDKAGRVYQAVCSCGGSGMNTTPDAWATSQVTSCDIGVFKIDFDIATVTATGGAAPSTSGCAPFTIDFTYTGQDAEDIFWDFGTGDTSTDFDPSYTFLNSGTYTVTQVVDAENTCNGTDTFYLQIDVLDDSSTVTDTAFCQGAVDLFLDVSTVNADYEWQDGTTGATYQVETTGTYWVDVMILGCTRRDSFVVGSTTPISVDLGEDQSICDILTYTIDASDPFAAEYQWQDGSTGPTLEIDQSGDYWVVLTDSVGCLATDTISLLFAATPDVDLGPDINICQGEEAVIDATTPGATYVWQDGSTDPTYTTGQDGVYSVIVEVEGCTDEDQISLTNIQSLPLELGTFSTFCDMPTFNLDASTSGAVSFEWNTGSTNHSIDISNSGNYSVTVYDAFDCPTEDEVDLVFSTTPVISFPDTTICDGETVTFGVSIPGATYQWQDGSTDPFFTVTETGAYTLLVDNNGCEASENVFVNYAINPGVEFATTDVLCADDTNGAIETVFATGGNQLTFLWENGSTEPDLSNLSPGAYNVTLTNEWNCIYEAAVLVNSPPPIVYETDQKDVICPGDANGWITIGNVDGGISPYLYSFAGEELSENPILRDISGGVYEVVVQDENGCTSSQMIDIYEPPSIIVDAGPNKYIKLGDSTLIDAAIDPTTFNQMIGWTPSDSLGCVDCLRPFAGPYYTTTYALTVHDTITGCTLRDTMTVFVEKPKNVFIPNAFSPNDDLQNDIFFINTDQSVVKINYLRVFDRWGEILFEDINFPPNDPTYGYDGKLDGKYLNPQVLVYIAEIEFIDGEVKTYHGDVTLMR